MQEESRYAEQREDPATVKTVLIVEDNADIAEVLILSLREETAYQVIHMFDGLAALTMVQTCLPHLVLLDYWLPGMDGLQCLNRLRATKGMEQTPVILMSVAPLQQIQVRTNLTCLEKPFGIDTLLDLIRRLLEKS